MVLCRLCKEKGWRNKHVDAHIKHLNYAIDSHMKPEER